MHDIDRAMFETEQESYENPSYEVFENESYEAEYELDSRESELAAELLEVTNEAELEQFLGNLLSSAVSAARGFAGSAAGRALGGVLKNAARQVLPQVGQVIGNALAPGAGGQFGQRAGSWLGRQFEYEGLSAEDREFEAARAFVRVANDAARRTVNAPPGVTAQQAAQAAVIAAARRSMPGLVPLLSTSAHGHRSTGRWVRHGHRIVLFGA
jgi:hypothetical protein